MTNEATGNALSCVHSLFMDLLTALINFISLDNDNLEAPQPFPDSRARIEFYRVFKREVDEYESDFINKHQDQATTTLIFVSSPICPR